MSETSTMRSLNTTHFETAIKHFDAFINRFEQTREVSAGAFAFMRDNWKGMAQNAFEADCDLARVNLRDLSDLMHELRNELAGSYASYLTTDSALSSNYGN